MSIKALQLLGSIEFGPAFVGEHLEECDVGGLPVELREEGARLGPIAVAIAIEFA